jgi:hypothetical protein
MSELSETSWKPMVRPVRVNARSAIGGADLHEETGASVAGDRTRLPGSRRPMILRDALTQPANDARKTRVKYRLALPVVVSVDSRPSAPVRCRK